MRANSNDKSNKIWELSKDDTTYFREQAIMLRDLKQEQSCLSSDELSQVMKFAKSLNDNRPYDHRRTYKTKVTVFQDCMTVNLYEKPVPYSTKEEMDIRAAKKNRRDTNGQQMHEQFLQMTTFDQLEFLSKHYHSCDEEAERQFFRDCFMPQVEVGETFALDRTGDVIKDAEGRPTFRKIWTNEAAFTKEKSIESKALQSYKEAVKMLYYNFKDAHVLLNVTHGNPADDTKVRNAFKNWLKNHIKPQKYCVFIDYTVKDKVTFKLFIPPATVKNINAAQKAWKHGTVKKLPQSIIEYTSAGCIVDAMPLNKFQINARLKQNIKDRLFIASTGIPRPLELKGLAAETLLHEVVPAVVDNTRIRSGYNDAFPHTRLTILPTMTPKENYK